MGDERTARTEHLSIVRDSRYWIAGPNSTIFFGRPRGRFAAQPLDLAASSLPGCWVSTRYGLNLVLPSIITLQEATSKP